MLGHRVLHCNSERTSTTRLYQDRGQYSSAASICRSAALLWVARPEMECNTMIRAETPGRCLMTPSNVGDPSEAGPVDLNGLCVLVVEDSWDVGTGLKMLLESWGADIVGPVATTADALRLVSERRPDLALVDINLRDGEQSYGLINQLHDQGIRVVVISGYADVSPAHGKVVAILQKPMREDLLLASIRAARAQ